MVNLELYRVFYTVAEVKNITKASEILNISQPAVTKHIKNLEDQLGNPLFIRTKKGVVLNEFGEKMFLNVKQALTLIDESEKEISMSKDMNKGTIKIGIGASLAKKFLIKYIDSFHKMYPNIIIDIYTDPTIDSLKKLKNGTIDMIVSKFPKEIDMDLNYIKLGRTKYIFAASDKYNELKGKVVTLEELSNYPMLLPKAPCNSRTSVDNYFKSNNIRITPKMNIASSSLLSGFLSVGYGIGYVTKLYVEDELKNKKLFEIKVEKETEFIDYGIITLKNNVMASHCNKFIKHLEENKF